MSPQRADIKTTYEQYRHLPETGPRYQLIDGELIMSPAPTSRHQKIVLRIAAALLAFVERNRLGEVFCAPIDVILSGTDVLQPDILFVAEARRKTIAREGIVEAPDLCIEVLSESTRAVDLGAKKMLYAKHGVREFWAVDPEENWIEVYRLSEDASSPFLRLDASGTLTTDIIPGFSLELRAIFAG